MKKKTLLLEWMRSTPDIEDKMLWKKAAEQQMCFVRDTLALSLLHVPVFVLSTHTSKSIKLPVYGMELRNGIEVIMRENFYGWVVSIKTPIGMELMLDPVSDRFYGESREVSEGQYKHDADIPHCYCEGFSEDWVYPFYREGCRMCTVRIDSDYQLYTLLYMLRDVPNLKKEKFHNFGKHFYGVFLNMVTDLHPDMELFELFPTNLSNWNFQHRVITDKEDREDIKNNMPMLCEKYPEFGNEFMEWMSLYYYDKDKEKRYE